MLQSEQVTPYLTEEDILQMQQYFDAIPSTQATYSDFYPLAKEFILRVYRVKDPTEVSLHSWYTSFGTQTGVANPLLACSLP